MSKKLLDTTLQALLVVIGLLLLTGGFFYASGSLKLELSQIDAFSWAVFILAFIRKKFFGDYFPPKLQNRFFTLTQKISKRPWFFLGIALTVYFALQTWVSVWRYQSFHANAYDLSYLDQPLWATAHFADLKARFPEIKILHSTLSVGKTYLGEHFAPILISVSALYKIWDSVYMLFVFQSLVFLLSSVLIFKLARIKGLSPLYSTLVAACFLIYRPLRTAHMFDFREDSLFIPIFLSAMIAAERRKMILFWCLAALSWTVKENAALFTFLMGLWFLIKPPHASLKKHGLVLSLLSCLVFFIVSTKLTPYFSGAVSQTRFAARLGILGNSPSEILNLAFTQPILFFQKLSSLFLQKSILKYFLIVSIPFIWFAKHSPIVALIALAGFLMNVILGITSIGFHYECVFLAFLFYVLISGIAKSNLTKNAAFPALLVLSFLLFFGRSPVYALRQFVPNAHHRFIEKELQKIPPTASIATQTLLHPHLAHRKDAYLFQGKPHTDFVIVDLSSGMDLYGTPNLEADANAIDVQEYEKIVDRNSLRIWHKRNPGRSQ